MSRWFVRRLVALADVVLFSAGGAAPTLMVLAVLVVAGVRPYAGILSDLRGLLRFLID